MMLFGCSTIVWHQKIGDAVVAPEHLVAVDPDDEDGTDADE
jgi:hypothetical protein